MTQDERKKVAELVEALKRFATDESSYKHTLISVMSRAAYQFDALLAEPAKGGPCKTCLHESRESIYGVRMFAWCKLASGENPEDWAVPCATLGGGCWAWKERAK